MEPYTKRNAVKACTRRYIAASVLSAAQSTVLQFEFAVNIEHENQSPTTTPATVAAANVLAVQRTARATPRHLQLRGVTPSTVFDLTAQRFDAGNVGR
jgi:hypothetical protein